jgi:hypothetical protein
MVLRVVYRQRGKYKGMLWSIFVTKIHEEPEGCNKLNNEEQRDTYPKQIFFG